MMCTVTHAAEKIRWEDLLNRLDQSTVCPAGAGCFVLVEHRGVDVISQDGRKHHTRRLEIDSSGVRLYDRHGKMEARHAAW
jgi:hypothetical protein